MAKLPGWQKERFMAARFMDDILLVYAASATWDHVGFVRDFTKSDCYTAPLTLVDAKDNTFLETTFAVEGNRFRRWLKNDNSEAKPHAIWRYQDFASSTPFERKRAVILASMRKVHAMASDRDALHASAIQKLLEFRRLRYPASVLRGICTVMATVTATYEWIKIRDEVSTWRRLEQNSTPAARTLHIR